MTAEKEVVVVTGASRGLGRGIARAFGDKGATVYVTARELASLGPVVDEVTERGGTAVAVACDHRNDDAVRHLFHRVSHESGRLDMLVNNAAAVDYGGAARPAPFWEKPLHTVDMLEVGLRSNYVAAYYAVPLMLGARHGLIASISFYGSVSYFQGPAYGAAKAGTDKMMADMAIELKPYGVAAVSIWPGFILTDMIKSVPSDQLPTDIRSALPQWEHPEFTGLVIDALFHDPELLSLSGRTLIGADLGRRYGIADIDGKQPIDYRATMGSPSEPFVGS